VSWPKLAAITLLVLGLLLVCLTFEVWAAAFLGLLFALSLNGPADWIRSRWPMPAWAATVLTMLMVLTVLTGLGFLIGPPLVEQGEELGKELPAAMEKSLDWLEGRKWGRTVVRQAEALVGVSKQPLNSEDETQDEHAVLSQALTIDAPPQQPPAAEQAGASPETDPVASEEVAAGGPTESSQQLSAAGNGERSDDRQSNGNRDRTDAGRSMIFPILQTLTKTFAVTATTLMLFVVSFMVTVYVALDPDVYHRGILWLIPAEHERAATQTLSHLCVTLRWWMLGRLGSMLAIGVLTSLGMWLVGMPAPVALGTMAGLFSFVPNIGPIVSAVPGLLLAVPEGPWMLLSALGVYVVAQIIESNLISPLIDQSTVEIPPALLIFFQVIMGVLSGAWGVVIATPLLVVVMVLTQQLYVREHLKKPLQVIGSTADETPDEGK
jgi:predicted PurR-regulated permease PerM